MTRTGLFSLARGIGGPGALRGVPGFLLKHLAARRRKAGCYDLLTLWLFRAAWRRSRSASAWVDYLLFRRDLGYVVPERARGELARVLPCLDTRRARRVAGMLRETGGNAVIAVEGSADEALHRLQTLQGSWRKQFADALAQAGSVSVVGNAGWLQGAGLGQLIDASGMVVRFNRCWGPQPDAADLGCRLHVWVAAPGFAGPAPEGVDWIIVSGPDMRHRRADWRPLLPALEAGTPVLTVPLAPWRDLVRELKAPPSAGLLCLRWFRDLLGGWETIIAIGFGDAPGRPYHQADAGHRAVGRHNWNSERQVLEGWQKEGLKVVGHG